MTLWEADRRVFTYRFGETRTSKSVSSDHRSCYVHPIYGLDGEVLTDEFPQKDHPYHRGLFWAWPHITIAGEHYESWTLEGLQNRFVRWLDHSVADGVAILAVENGWFVANDKVMRETVRLRTATAVNDIRTIDVELSWVPTDRPVTLRCAEGKGYGGLTLRFAPRRATTIVVPKGRTTEDLLEAKLPWADLTAAFKRDDELSGIAILANPSNTNFPPTWMARHYGLLATGWPGVTDHTLAPGDGVVCKYRLVLHRNAMSAQKLNDIYDAYREGGGAKRGISNEP